MSSLRNAVQRRNHRERAQPQEREKWGLLEKRKDYKLRATDHKVKKRKINALKQKASDRNEDEFYFGMMNSTSEGGIKRSKRNEANSGGGGKILSEDVVKLMKTQDQGYLQTMLQRTIRERERLEEDVLLAGNGIDSAPSKCRVVFDEDRKLLGETEDEWEDDLQDDAEENVSPEERDAKLLKKHRLDVGRRKLEALREQESKLSAALEGVNEQRARMNRTVGGMNKQGVKFKQRERKR